MLTITIYTPYLTLITITPILAILIYKKKEALRILTLPLYNTISLLVSL
jgi:hypothetical protein